MTAEELRGRALAARALMDDPTTKEAWDAVEADIRDEWERGSGWGAWNKRRRERLWIELQAVKAFRRKLASFAGFPCD